MQKLGHDGLIKMLSGFDDKTAFALCIVAYVGAEGEEPKIFVGKASVRYKLGDYNYPNFIKGKIVLPKGEYNYGYDRIFQPEGFDQTYAEMDRDLKNAISHRSLALQEMIKYIQRTNE